jgi:hypothetical protein
MCFWLANIYELLAIKYLILFKFNNVRDLWSKGILWEFVLQISSWGWIIISCSWWCSILRKISAIQYRWQGTDAYSILGPGKWHTTRSCARMWALAFQYHQSHVAQYIAYRNEGRFYWLYTKWYKVITEHYGTLEDLIAIRRQHNEHFTENEIAYVCIKVLRFLAEIHESINFHQKISVSIV